MDPQADPTVQPVENAGKEKSATASRLTVAGVLALVGARLGAEVTVLYNLTKDILSGKHRAPSDDGVFIKFVKMTFSSINQKSTYVAAGIGAAALGTLGWIRGSRIDHPTDLLKHPLNSFKAIFGKQSETKSEVRPDSTQPPLSDGQSKDSPGNAWQQKITAQQAAVSSTRGSSL